MLNSTSLAAGVGVGVVNVQFAPDAQNLPRKIFIVGTYDPAKVGIVADTPQRVLSPEDAGDRYGFGSMVHRLSIQAFRGSAGIETYVIPQEETGGAAAADGSIDFTDSSSIGAGTLYLYIANLLVRVNITAGMTAAQIATAVAAAVNAIKELPVSAAVDGVAAGQVNFTSKSKGPWGNSITIALNLGAGQTAPVGIVATITGMVGGAGVPDIATALVGLGTGDGANEDGFTDGVHGYGQDSATLDAISEYVGSGNELTGLYAATVGRPFRMLVGDTATGSSGLSDLITLADGRKLDRASGVIAVPGSASHPAEIAAQAIGHMARINQERVAQSYVDVELIGIHPGARGDRWTSEYDNRNAAVAANVSPTRIRNGVVCMQNVLSFYHPDNVPVASNGYRSMRNIGIIQNILAATRLNFEQAKWQGISIVGDTVHVTNTIDRQKARDTDAVKDDLVALAHAFASKAWLFEAAFTIRKLKEAGAVTIRPGGTGFNSILSVIFSGEGGILDTSVEFDTSLAVLLAA